ncbi:hypothetical protein V6103_24185, partial [Klebsiella pneumoniae]
PCRPVARLCITLPSDRRVQKNLTTTSIDELQRGEAKEPEVISSTSDQKEQGTPKRDKRKIILD